MIEIAEVLKKVGLTTQEGRVYVALIELQEAQTGFLCKQTKIASSNIYKILESLMEKGLVSYRVQNNIKIFMPTPPETLNYFFLEKQEKLDAERKEVNELISNLKIKKITKEPYANYKYFEGLQGIRSMWHEINSLMDQSTCMKAYTTKKDSYKRFLPVYEEHHQLRMKKKMKSFLIFPKEDVALANIRRKQNVEVRFMSLKNDAEWGVIKDSFYIQYTVGKNPRSFLIQDENFAQTFKQVFDQLWQEAKDKP